MTRGRPPIWNPVAVLDDTVWTEAIEFASKGRCGIPVAARRRIEWWGQHAADGLLATLELDGFALLEPWARSGNRVLQEIRDLVSRTDPELRSGIVLAAMDRYVRVACEDNGRLLLPGNVIAHVDPAGAGRVRLIVMDGALRLCAEAEWQARRGDRLKLLSS